MPASHAAQCSDTSAAAGMFSRHASQLSPHAASFKSGLLMPVWKALSLGIRSESVLPSHSSKPAQPSSICKSRDDGNPHRCWRIMPKPNSPNAAQSHDSKMERRDDQDIHHPFSSCQSLQSCHDAELARQYYQLFKTEISECRADNSGL